jgi:hypothetical protein
LPNPVAINFIFLQVKTEFCDFGDWRQIIHNLWIAHFVSWKIPARAALNVETALFYLVFDPRYNIRKLCTFRRKAAETFHTRCPLGQLNRCHRNS